MLIHIIGYIAAFLTTVSFLPQVIQTIKTKDTSGISLLMYSLFVAGVFMWLIYGILLKNIAITSANLITLILAGIVLVMKIRSKILCKKEDHRDLRSDLKALKDHRNNGEKVTTLEALAAEMGVELTRKRKKK